jgi:hypothetical protein
MDRMSDRLTPTDYRTADRLTHSKQTLVDSLSNRHTD